MVSNGYLGRKMNYKMNNNNNNNKNIKMYERLGSCLVVAPPNGKKPRAIIKFLGGAFVGAVPEVTYRFTCT